MSVERRLDAMRCAPVKRQGSVRERLRLMGLLFREVQRGGDQRQQQRMDMRYKGASWRETVMLAVVYSSFSN